MAFPPAEIQWMQVHSKDGVDGVNMDNPYSQGFNLMEWIPPSVCPGLRQLSAGPEQFCTPGTTASDLLPDQVAIMTAQQYHPDNQKVGPIVPGVIGFAMGAAVVTSIVAMKKKRTSDLYSPLTEEVA